MSKFLNLLSIAKNRYNDNIGSIYIMALLALTIIFIVMMVFLNKIFLETKNIRSTTYGLQAFYIANAGLSDTIYELRKAGTGNYFSAANGWINIGPGNYNKVFPGVALVPAEYRGTYNVFIRVPGSIDDNKPSTFSANISGVRDADGEKYVRVLFVEGLWTLNKESVYITSVDER